MELEFITTKQLAQTAGVSEPTAQKVIRQVNDEIVARGGAILTKSRAPKSLVLAKLGLKGDNK